MRVACALMSGVGDDVVAVPDVRGEHAVVSGEVGAGSWDQRGEAGDEVEGVEDNVSGPVVEAPVYPICSNTHGGPVHDAKQRVIDAYGEPIPRLYAAGELGGVFGHLYLAGGNMAECLVGGWIAGREAGSLERWG